MLLNLVVDVEVPLLLILGDHSRFFQKEVWDLSSIRFTSSTELDLEIFTLGAAKTRGRLAISQSLWQQHWLHEIQETQVHFQCSLGCTPMTGPVLSWPAHSIVNFTENKWPRVGRILISLTLDMNRVGMDRYCGNSHSFEMLHTTLS